MVEYYKLYNGEFLAKSSRGIYVFDTVDRIWIAAYGIYTDNDLKYAEKITESEIDRMLHERKEVLHKYRKSVYVTKISVRNDIGVKYSDPEYVDSMYINEIPVIQQLVKGRELHINRPVTFFVGDNGTGKSTLLEAIAVNFGLNGEGGDRYFEFETKRTHSALYHLINVGRIVNPKDGFFLRAESFYNLASAIDDGTVLGRYGDQSLHKQSHGESFMYLIQNRFTGNGLYILDEPEAALSPSRILELMKEMKRLIDNNSQFIIATHSPILMAYPDAQIFECTESGIFEKRYYELDSFNLVKDFMNNPEYVLRSIGL